MADENETKAPSPQELNEAVELFRKSVDGKKFLTEDEHKKVLSAIEASDEAQQKAAKAEAKASQLEQNIAEQGELIEKMGTDLKDSTEKVATLQAEAKALELLLAQKTGGENTREAFHETPEWKTFEQYLQKGDVGYLALDEESKAMLRTDVDGDGGFLVPTEMDTQLLKEIVEIDAIRPLTRVRSIGGKALDMPVRTAIPVATFEGEGEPNDDAISAYRLVTATPYRQTITIPATMDILMNAGFDMEAELIADASEAFALGEGLGFVKGTGFKEPEGVTMNATVVANAMSAIDYTDDDVLSDAIMTLTGELKVGYNAVFNCSRRTLARLRRLKGSDGHFLWQPGLDGSAANSIAGVPYVITPSMDDHDAGSASVPLMYADWRAGYTVIDRIGTSVIRDNVTGANRAIVKFTMHRWLTGIVTIPEAFKLLPSS